MKNNNYLRLIISLFLPLLLASCAATSVTGTWKEANYNKPIKKILVIGLTKEPANRRIFEDTLSQGIRDAGQEAQVSVKYFTDTKKISKETLAPIVKKENIDTVIIGRVVAVNKENQYVASGYPSSYNSMYGYYGRVSPYYGSGGYYVENTIVSLEFNLYETTNAKLVWALTTETFQPGNINKEIAKISKLIVKELTKEKLLSTPQ
ncbi:MAG: hypothetical protein ACC657_07110 [Thiohalomonadales bacterium]